MPRVSAEGTVRPPASSHEPVSPAWVLADLDRWVSEPALADLLAAYDQRLPAGGLAERLTWLEQFSAQYWDFRSGRERDFIDQVDLPPQVDVAALEAAARLGLTTSAPPSSQQYSHVVVLGGLARACLLRPAFTAGLVHRGLRAETVTGLAGFRPLSEMELSLLDEAGRPPAADEVEVMQQGLVAAFSLESTVPATDASGGRGAGDRMHRRWAVEDGPDIDLVAAPSSDPATRRANSADTYAFWASEVAALAPGDTVLLVTSCIYVPFQGCDAVRVLGLPRGVAVETVGVDVQDEKLGPLRQTFRAPHFLQELRSTVRSVRTLHAEIDPQAG